MFVEIMRTFYFNPKIPSDPCLGCYSLEQCVVEVQHLCEEALDLLFPTFSEMLSRNYSDVR